MPTETHRYSPVPGRRVQTAPPVAAGRSGATGTQTRSSAALALTAVAGDQDSTARSAYFGVGKVADPSEHEANAVAERVMRMPPAASPHIGHTHFTATTPAPRIVDDVLRSPGRPSTGMSVQSWSLVSRATSATSVCTPTARLRARRRHFTPAPTRRATTWCSVPADSPRDPLPDRRCWPMSSRMSCSRKGTRASSGARPTTMMTTPRRRPSALRSRSI